MATWKSRAEVEANIARVRPAELKAVILDLWRRCEEQQRNLQDLTGRMEEMRSSLRRKS